MIAAAITGLLLDAFPYAIVEHIPNMEHDTICGPGRCDIVQLQYQDRWCQLLFEPDGVIALASPDKHYDYCDPGLLSWILGKIYDDTGARPDDPTLDLRWSSPTNLQV